MFSFTHFNSLKRISEHVTVWCNCSPIFYIFFRIDKYEKKNIIYIYLLTQLFLTLIVDAAIVIMMTETIYFYIFFTNSYCYSHISIIEFDTEVLF